MANYMIIGASSGIGKALAIQFATDGHEAICCVRDKNRFNKKNYAHENLNLTEANFLKRKSSEYAQ